MLRVLPFALLGVAAPLAGCGSDRRFLDGGPSFDGGGEAGRDATGTDAVDGGLDVATPDVVEAAVDVGLDAGMDAGTEAGRDALADAVDAAADVRADVPTDAALAGRCTPTIDGVVGADWPTNALVERNTASHAWMPNALNAIRVCYDATNLYLGIEGFVEPMNGIVVYLDRDFRGGAGGSATGVSIFSVLTDGTGSLDDTISAGLTVESGASGFGAELAWGTRGMRTLAAMELNDMVGLRSFATPSERGNFAWLTGARTECATMPTGTCEVALAWASIYGGPRPPSATVALFARINNGDGTMSAPDTLPQDNPTMPRAVNRVLTLDVRP